MEDSWKKFKEEIQEHIQKINEFLNETSSNEKSNHATKQISRHLVLDEETLLAIKNANKKSNETFNKKPKISSRKKIYGKLKDIVKEIMEKENLSRAQAYRKAKKRLLNNF